MSNTIDVQVCGNRGMFPCTYKTVVLKPNIINDKNILNQGMMNMPNTKYVIKYDFLLSDAIVEKTANVISTNVSHCGNSAYATALAAYNLAHDAWIDADNAYTNNPNDTTLAAKNAAYDTLESAQLTLNGTPQYYYFAGSAINIKKGQHITIPEGCVLLNDTTISIVNFDVAPNDMTVYIGNTTTGSYDYKIQSGIIMPANCLIEFDGGSISNGAIVGDDTYLIFNQNEEDILKNVTLLGNFIYPTANPADKKDNVNGMAKIYLKKNKSFISQVTQSNTIYVIQYDFNLEGESVTIPENCVLEFDGGSLNNGSILFDDTLLEGKVILNTLCYGTIANECSKASWFTSDSVCSSNIEFLVNCCCNTDIDKDVIITSFIKVEDKKINLYSSNNSTIKVNCLPSYPEVDNSVYAWIHIKNSPSVNIHDVHIDFEEKQYPVPKDNNNNWIEDFFIIEYPMLCELYNLHIEKYGSDSGNLQYDAFRAFDIRISEKSTVNIHNIIFNDIKVVGDGAFNNRGVGGCILVSYLNLVPNVTSPVLISNIYCKNCYNINLEGGTIHDDFDCIHVASQDVNNRLTRCEIRNCYFENVNKRAIKAQAQNITVEDVVYTNPGKIDGLNYVIQPFGDMCNVKNVSAYMTVGAASASLNDTPTVITGTFTTNLVCENIKISADEGLSTIFGICGAFKIANCIFKNITNPIIATRYQNTGGKIYGDDYPTKDYEYDYIENCRFINNYIVYNSMISSYVCRAKFVNCLFYNSSTIKAGDYLEMDGCTIIRKVINGAPSMSALIRTITVNDPNNANIDYYPSIIIRNCKFDYTNDSTAIVYSEYTAFNPRSVHPSFVIDGCSIVNKVYPQTEPATEPNNIPLFTRDETLAFENFTIKNTITNNVLFVLQTNYSGKLSIVNSEILLGVGSAAPKLLAKSEGVAFYNAPFENRKIDMTDVMVTPNYNSLALRAFVNNPSIVPGKGTTFYQYGKNTISNGTKWVDEHGFTPTFYKTTTANRPTGTAGGGILTAGDVGIECFDTNLYIPIYAKVINQITGEVTWVDATGNIV